MLKAKMIVTGGGPLVAQLQNLKKGAQRASGPKAVAGYSAPYAVYVHERTDVYHPVGQAKFLETAAAQQRGAMASLIADQMRKGRSINQATLTAAQLLLRESNRLVPVDTGFLRDSGRARVAPDNRSS